MAILLVIALVSLMVLGALPGASSASVGSSAAYRPSATLIGGCGGSASSLTTKGKLLGSFTVPGAPKASKSRPLLIDPKGSIHYRGGTPVPFTKHHWHVALFGITVRSGGSLNIGNKAVTAGIQNLKALPLRFTGLYYLSGAISGLGGSCSGSLWVKVIGSPMGTIPWYLGVVLLVLGVLTLLWSFPHQRALTDSALRRHWIRGALAGLLIGLASNILLVIYSAVAFDGLAPILVVLVAPILVGVILGWSGPVIRRRPRPVAGLVSQTP